MKKSVLSMIALSLGFAAASGFAATLAMYCPQNIQITVVSAQKYSFSGSYQNLDPASSLMDVAIAANQSNALYGYPGGSSGEPDSLAPGVYNAYLTGVLYGYYSGSCEYYAPTPKIGFDLDIIQTTTAYQNLMLRCGSWVIGASNQTQPMDQKSCPITMEP